MINKTYILEVVTDNHETHVRATQDEYTLSGAERMAKSLHHPDWPPGQYLVIRCVETGRAVGFTRCYGSGHVVVEPACGSPTRLQENTMETKQETVLLLLLALRNSQKLGDKLAERLRLIDLDLLHEAGLTKENELGEIVRWNQQSVANRAALGKAEGK